MAARAIPRKLGKNITLTFQRNFGVVLLKPVNTHYSYALRQVGYF
jgi:hypothetical protein